MPVKVRLFGGRDLLVLVDTALLSGASVLLLVIAARALTPGALSVFALAQPIVATAVGTQRAAVLAPALVVRRTAGDGWVPLGWIARVSLPISLIAAFGTALVVGGVEHRPAVVGGAMLAAVIAALAQDVARYRLLSQGRVRGALISDAVLVVLIAATALLIPVVHDWPDLLLLWAGALAVALVVALWQLGRLPSGEALPPIRLRAVWPLGRWAGLDSLLGTASYLLPLFISSLVLGNRFAGVYRVLQAANGPLNVLDTAIVTSFGLAAVSIVSSSDVLALRSRVRRLVPLMMLFAGGYLVIAQVLIIVLSGVTGPDLVRIAVVVLIAGMIGAVTTPLSAGALSLGKQASGAIIRAVVVTFSVGISLAAAFGLPVPFGDPIGLVALFAPAATAVGWFLSFRAAARSAQRDTLTVEAAG